MLLQEAQPHKAEAVAVTGSPVIPSQLSENITLDDLAASLRLEHTDVAAALIKARDSLQEQARLQQQKQAKEAAIAEAAAAAQMAKPKVITLSIVTSELATVPHTSCAVFAQVIECIS